MKFFGLQKVSLVDYPKHICATVFTKGCNMRCGFCHNPDLVFPQRKVDPIDEAKIITFLEQRKNKLDGICITGGEPTLHARLPDFIKRVKQLGFKVKLDTNGTNPKMLKSLLAENLVDFIAMDVKSSPGQYCRISCMAPVLLPRVMESIEMIKKSSIPFEFRTTLVRGIHDSDEIQHICKLIDGSPQYTLQRSLNENAWNASFQKIDNFSDSEMQTFVDIAKQHFKGNVTWH